MVSVKAGAWKWVGLADGTNVRFGSKADICSATADVRFTLNSDRESGFLQRAMSAFPRKRTCALQRGMSALCQ